MLLEVNSYLKHLNICDLSFLVCLASFDQILNQKEEKRKKTNKTTVPMKIFNHSSTVTLISTKALIQCNFYQP